MRPEVVPKKLLEYIEQLLTKSNNKNMRKKHTFRQNSSEKT